MYLSHKVASIYGDEACYQQLSGSDTLIDGLISLSELTILRFRLPCYLLNGSILLSSLSRFRQTSANCNLKCIDLSTKLSFMFKTMSGLTYISYLEHFDINIEMFQVNINID